MDGEPLKRIIEVTDTLILKQKGEYLEKYLM